MASKRTSFKSLSRRARSLLARQEDLDVEFKRSINGLETSDIVAFANSPGGGTILVGVDEETRPDGTQGARIVGCSVGDGPKLKIINKALHCSPSIPVELFVENTSDKPFYRLEIPSGDNKPYATQSGTYKIRHDGRVKALSPQELLDLFLRREADAFRDRFSQATAEIVQTLRRTLSTVGDIEAAVHDAFSRLEGTVGWAESSASDAANGIADVDHRLNNIEAQVNSIENCIAKTDERMIALLAYVGADDPVKTRARSEMVDLCVQELQAKPELVKADAADLQFTGVAARLFTKDELVEIVAEAKLKLDNTT